MYNQTSTILFMLFIQILFGSVRRCEIVDSNDQSNTISDSDSILTDSIFLNDVETSTVETNFTTNSTTVIATNITKLTTETNAISNEVIWEYWGPRGEQHWQKSFKSCGGKSQSPINIETDRIVYLPDLQLYFINYDRPLYKMRLTNTGHTVKLEASEQTGKRYQWFISGNALFDQTYRFVELHFHWRNAHSAGSEHAINGEKFSMEVGAV